MKPSNLSPQRGLNTNTQTDSCNIMKCACIQIYYIYIPVEPKITWTCFGRYFEGLTSVHGGQTGMFKQIPRLLVIAYSPISKKNVPLKLFKDL